MAAAPTRLEFTGASGDQLAARLDRPSEPHAFALFAHCFTCGKDLAAAGTIARALGDGGIAVLRFDFTGLGSSEGEFANTDFSSNVGDLVAAAAHLRDHHQAPRLIVGHSLGGAAVLAAAEQIPEARAVATIGAPADPSHVEHLLADATPKIERGGEAEVVLGGRPFTVRREFFDDIRSQALLPKVTALDRALIVFHAPRGELVGVDNARRIFDAARHPKSFVSLDDADHLLSRREDATYVGDVLAAWAARYLRG
ncbi:MAG TPA: alpha/beta hydrolase [Solirubrobacterales bacterium]|nr:alpha/beta hydrolase [Solirubrobacterales bacterium]